MKQPGYFEDSENTGACRPACDPLGSDCAAGEGCYLRTDTGRAACLVPYSYGTQGAACAGLNDCAPGYGCLTSGCGLYCDASASGGPSCEVGLQCQAITVSPMVGICVAE